MISDNWWQKIWLFIFLIIIIYDDFDRYFTGRTPSIVIADTEILQEILIKQFNNFTDRAVSWAALNSRTGVRKQIIYNYSIEVPESLGVNNSISKMFQEDARLVELHSKINEKNISRNKCFGIFLCLGRPNRYIHVFSVNAARSCWDFRVQVCKTISPFCRSFVVLVVPWMKIWVPNRGKFGKVPAQYYPQLLQQES